MSPLGEDAKARKNRLASNLTPSTIYNGANITGASFNGNITINNGIGFKPRLSPINLGAEVVPTSNQILTNT